MGAEGQPITGRVPEQYIVFLDANLAWNLDQVQAVEQAWREGEPVEEIARAQRRDPDEVALLIMDRVRQKGIFPRPGGARGNASKKGRQGNGGTGDPGGASAP